MSVGIVRIQLQRNFELPSCLVETAWNLRQGISQIVVGFSKIGIDSQRGLILCDRLLEMARFFGERLRQIMVRHPTLRISRERGAVKRFFIAVDAALPPAQNAEKRDQRGGNELAGQG